MILFPTSRALQNILQDNSSKTFLKHNLFFSNITSMEWIHRIQCWKHLNPDLPHACVTESFGPQLQLVLYTCTWGCTPANDVCRPTTSVATLLLVFQICEWCCALAAYFPYLGDTNQSFTSIQVNFEANICIYQDPHSKTLYTIKKISATPHNLPTNGLDTILYYSA